MSSRRAAALVLVLSLLTTCGCVQLPQRVTRITDARPSLTDAAAVKLINRFRALESAAWKKQDGSALNTISTGPALDTALAGIAMEKRVGGKHRSSDLHSSVLHQDARYVARSTPGGHYPALAVISGFGKGKKRPDSFYLAERTSAVDPWMVSFHADDGLNTFLPEITDTAQRTFDPVDSKTTINGSTVEKMPDLLTTALLDPSGKDAARFVANDLFNDTMGVPLDKKRKHLTQTYHFIGTPWHQAYRIGDGGMIIFGGFTETIRYDNTDNYYSYFTGGPHKKLLPDKYSSLTYTYDYGFALRVPKKGKLALHATSWGWESLTGDRWTGY